MTSTNLQKLESLLDSDQESIRLFRAGKITPDELSADMLSNQKYVSDFIDQNGFPFKDSTSDLAYRSAFITILHSADIGLMEETIELFSKASETNIIKKDLGYLVDKVQVLKNLPQVYGTQYKVGVGRTISFLPIKDEQGVDARRAELGMEPLAQYKKFAEENLR